MPSVKVGVEYIDEEVVQALRQLLKATGDLRPVFQDFGEYLIPRSDEMFTNEEDPFGKPWQQLADSTLLADIGGAKARKKRGGTRSAAIKRLAKRKILTRDGILRGSVNWRATKESLTFGYNTIYAAIHQFGGKAGRNQSAEIPARPFLGIAERDRDKVLAVIEDHYRDALKKA